MTETNDTNDQMTPAEEPRQSPVKETADALDDMAERVESGKQDSAAAADEIEVTAVEVIQPAAEEPEAEEAQYTETEQPTIMDRLASDSEFDPDASNDDRVMAALAYASQLLIPFLVPIIILISETSKRRPFQRYHAIQSIGVAVVIYGLELALVMAASVSAATIILWLCLCFIFPAMIALWLLPLYYAIMAYNGKRFRVPGLTQFLQDQRWI